MEISVSLIAGLVIALFAACTVAAGGAPRAPGRVPATVERLGPTTAVAAGLISSSLLRPGHPMIPTGTVVSFRPHR